MRDTPVSRDLTRYVESSERDAPPERAYLRTLLRTESEARPSDATLAEVGARLGLDIGWSGAASGPGPSRWRHVALVAALAALTLAAFGVSETPAPSAMPDRTPENTAASSSARPNDASSKDTQVPELAVESLPRAPARAEAHRSTCSDEVELLERADTALGTGDAARAIAFTREHAARCPAGAFVQERERIAIEALARLGDTANVRQRARAFEERYPRSPHLHRIRRLARQPE